MAELVDAIVADLTVKYDQYVAGFDKATAAHQRFTKSVPKIGAMGGFTQAEAQQYADRHSKVGEAAEKAGEKRKRAAKGASDTEKAEAKAAADAVKKAAREREKAERAAARAAEAAVKAAEREKQAALKATQREQEKAARAAAAKAEAERAAAAVVVAAAEREAAARARLAEVAQRAIDRRGSGLAPAVGGRIGATVPREATGQASIPLNVLNSGARAEAEAEKEINHLLADQAVLSSQLVGLKGRERDVVRDQLAEIRLTRQLERTGLDDAAIALRLEERRAAVAGVRSRNERSQANRGLEQYARGAGLSAATGGGAAIAGIATAVGVGVGVEVIRSAVEYGKALDDLSKQLGITVEDLQAYLQIARDTGVEQATLSSAFGQFASNLGRAQQGQEEYSKVFKALGVDIKDFSTAGDALPTIIERISSIKDPLQRAAVETRLFGEEGRKLDPLLSGGADGVSKLSAALQETGRALSAQEIKDLDATARKLAEVKNQLQVDFARIVAGNADAIIGLAQSFSTLVNSIGGAIQKLQQFSAEQIRAGKLPGDPVKAKQFQISNEYGRGRLYADNNAALAANRQRFRILPNDERLLAAQPAGSPAKTVAQLKREQLAAANAPVLAERREIVAAARQAVSDRNPTPPVQAGSVNMGLIRNLGAPNPPKGKSAESLAREEEQRTRQFNDQLAQATADYLRAQEQLTASADKRAAIELELLDTASKARIADIESQRKRNVLAGADAGIEAARAAELTAAERRARDADKAVIEQDRQLDNARALTSASATLLDVQATLLNSQLAVARTVAERRDVELRLLDNVKEQERNRLQGIINSSRPGDPAAADAQAQLGTLDQRTDAQRRAISYRNRGPLEEYRDNLPRTADQMNEALESVKARGLASFDDALTDSISKVFKLGGAFGSVANGIISDLIRIGVQRAIIGPLADSLFGAAGGTGGGGLGNLLGKIGLGGTRAVGGNVVAGVPYLVGERGPEPVVFGQSGRVYPNGSLPQFAGATRGGTALHQTIHIDASGVNPDGYTASIVGIVRRETAQAIGQNNGAIRKSLPAAQDRYGKLGTTG
jgi:hypothetical protein